MLVSPGIPTSLLSVCDWGWCSDALHCRSSEQGESFELRIKDNTLRLYIFVNLLLRVKEKPPIKAA
jgi:hypothetical protein